MFEMIHGIDKVILGKLFLYSGVVQNEEKGDLREAVEIKSESIYIYHSQLYLHFRPNVISGSYLRRGYM